MNYPQQSLYSDYYYRQPINSQFLVNIGTSFYSRHFSPLYCPFYAPVCHNGICRLCHSHPQDHKRYFIYSNYARKIQKAFLNYKFKKFYKNNYKKFCSINHTIIPFFVLAQIYKKRYFRKWNTFTLEMFSKNVK